MALDNKNNPDQANIPILDQLDGLLKPATQSWSQNYESLVSPYMDQAKPFLSMISLEDESGQNMIRGQLKSFFEKTGLQSAPIHFINVQSIEDLQELFSPEDYARLKAKHAQGDLKLSNFNGITPIGSNGLPKGIYLNVSGDRFKQDPLGILKEEIGHVQAAHLAASFGNGSLSSEDPNYAAAAAFWGNINGGNLTAGLVSHSAYSGTPLESSFHSASEQSAPTGVQSQAPETNLFESGFLSELFNEKSGFLGQILKAVVGFISKLFNGLTGNDPAPPEQSGKPPPKVNMKLGL